MTRIAHIITLFVILTGNSPGLAHTPLGGLAVAVSPDGKTIAMGGDNRTLYIIDGQTLNVQKRIWLQTTIWGLHFNKAGTKLIVEDTKYNLDLIDVKTLKSEKVVAKSGFFNTAQNVNMGAGLDRSFKGHTITIRDLTTLSTKQTIALEKKKVACFGLNPTATRLAVLLEAEKDSSEPTNRRVPREFKGIDKDIYRQKNDGKTSTLLVFDVATGTAVSTTKTFYTSRTGSNIVFAGDIPVVISSTNVNAAISPDGKVSLFKFGHGLNYGIGVSPDGQSVFAGGMARGSANKIGKKVETLGTQGTPFEVKKLPGWPEYFKGFSFDSQGAVYGSTSGYRLIKLTAAGVVVSATPVH